VVITGLALVALMPASSDAGTVAAKVKVHRVQAEAGKTIRIIAVIKAYEPLTATGRGTVRVGGERRRLFPRFGVQTLGPGDGYALALRPAPRVARQVARALTDGKILHASLAVILRNSAGVTQTTNYRVRLTKFRR
jgi:hypothetical protein